MCIKLYGEHSAIVQLNNLLSGTSLGLETKPATLFIIIQTFAHVDFTHTGL